jgi:2-O-methyltransferase
LNTDRPVILEIGANCGQTTIKFIENFPNAIIHCFEPDPRAIKKFKLLVNHPNVFLHEIAIGNTNGFIEFHQSAGGENIDPEGWDHSGSAKHPKAHLEMFPWVRFDNKIQVPIMKLDYWAQRNGISNIDFIWADVQGVEEDLIKGGEEILKRTRFIYTEHYDNECYSGQIKFDQLYQLLNRFLILKKYGNDVLLKNYFANKLLPSNIEGKFISDAISSGEFHLYLHHFDADPEFIYSDY